MSNENEEGKESQERKYAGKFETVEALEEGYKSASRVFQENENLKKQLEEFKAPEVYLKPSNLELSDKQIERLEKAAKNSNLTQAQFEKLAYERQVELNNKLASREEKIKNVGEENINILKDYINKNFQDYSEDAKGVLLENFVLNDTARESAMKHREKTLNSSIPGMSSVNPATYHVTDDDINKARDEAQQYPANQNKRNKYLKLLEARALQKRKS